MLTVCCVLWGFFSDMTLNAQCTKLISFSLCLKIWFKNRRRRQRAFMLRNMHPMILGNPIGINVGVPHNIIFNPQPAFMYLPHTWMWYPQPAWIRYPQPLPLGLLMPPVVPYPPLFMPAPQPLFYPPLPHGGPHPRVWAWFFSVFYP